MACRFLFIIAVLCFHHQNINAQIKNDTLTEVKVTGKKEPTKTDLRLNIFSPGLKYTSFDSTQLQQYKFRSIDNLLTQQTTVFVKSYGYNSLSTLNFRGSSAAQTTVLWNGIPIQNSALGIADVSVLPVMFINKVNVVYGGSSALWGSGNVGGALLLETDEPKFDTDKLNLSAYGSTGSFGQMMYGLSSSYSIKKWYFSSNIFSQSATNNFIYTNQLNKTERMTNCRLKGNAAIFQTAYKFNNGSVINLYGWYQEYKREIPPALFENYSLKQQTDKNLRLLADWKFQTIKNLWYIKTSLTKDEIDFNDDVVELHTINKSYQIYQEFGYKKNMNKFGQILIFVPIQITFLPVTDTNKSIKQQTKIAIAEAYDIKFYKNKLNISLNARQEVIDNFSVFTPGTDASFIFKNWLSIRANIQNTYRAPSLNELYYFPGGNVNLKPEHGLNEDIGYCLKINNSNINFIHDVSIFNRQIYDWILWLGGAIWTPHNIAQVRSRGIETENNFEYKKGSWTFKFGINTSYILATTVSSYIPTDGSIGKQIPYTPRYNGQINAGFVYKSITVNYNHTYTGYRFITSDESEYLLPYNIGNLQVLFNTKILHSIVQITAQCNNIWNQQYQVVAYRPMPGINWLLGCKLFLL